jgi:predicted GNAT family acetyltransferase
MGNVTGIDEEQLGHCVDQAVVNHVLEDVKKNIKAKIPVFLG